MFGLNVAAEDAPLIFYMNCYHWPSLRVELEIVLHGFFSD